MGNATRANVNPKNLARFNRAMNELQGWLSNFTANMALKGIAKVVKPKFDK